MVYASAVTRTLPCLFVLAFSLAACTPPPSSGSHEKPVAAAKAPELRKVDAQWCGEVWDHVFQLAIDELPAELAEEQIAAQKEAMAGERDNFLRDCQAQGKPQQLMCLQAAETGEDILKCG
jgi:hypothetical protein